MAIMHREFDKMIVMRQKSESIFSTLTPNPYYIKDPFKASQELRSSYLNHNAPPYNNAVPQSFVSEGDFEQQKYRNYQANIISKSNIPSIQFLKGSHFRPKQAGFGNSIIVDSGNIISNVNSGKYSSNAYGIYDKPLINYHENTHFRNMDSHFSDYIKRLEQNQGKLQGYGKNVFAVNDLKYVKPLFK